MLASAAQNWRINALACGMARSRRGSKLVGRRSRWYLVIRDSLRHDQGPMGRPGDGQLSIPYAATATRSGCIAGT